MPSRSFGEPIADQLGFVSGGVVHYNMDIEIERNVALDLIEKLAKLSCAMTRHTLTNDGSRFYSLILRLPR